MADLELFDEHRAQLERGSGLAPEVIAERGYRSVLGTKALAHLGFSAAQRRTPGLLVPVWGPDGSNGLYQFRPDAPRTDAEGRPIKYETPLRAGIRLDCPPRCRALLKDPSVPLW